MMDGRDFGPHRSVHVHSPLLTGLAMESHRLGAATAAGRIASSPGHLTTGHPTPVHTGKYMSSAMNLHSHHGDSFPGSSSPFLSGYMNSGLGGSSTPHGTPTSLPVEPCFRTPAPSNMQMGQLWASHPHEGFSHLPNSLYPSPYVPLSHLEHPSSGSSLLAQLGQHGLYESQKEGFYLSGHAGQSALHPQTAISRVASNQMPSSLLQEKDVVSHHKSAKDSSRDSSRDSNREKPCRTDLNLSNPRRERERHKEEPRPRSVVDLTQDTKQEGSERKVSGLDRPYKMGEHTSLFYREHSPGLGGGEPKSKNPLQTSSLSNCNSGSSSVKYQGSEQERCAKDPSRHDENMRPSAYVHADKPRKCDAVVTSSVGSSHVSCSCPSTHSNASQPAPRVLSSNTFPPTHHTQASLYTLYPSAKEPGREHKVIAPTFVPSVEVYDERNGPIQIASQARDNKNDKNRDKDGNKPGCLQAPSERTLVDPLRPPHAHESPLHGDVKRMEIFREEGSVIMSNCMATKRTTSSELFPVKASHSPDTRDLLLNSATSKEMMKMVLEAEARSQERERFQRAAARDSGKMYNGVDSSRIHMDQHQLKNSSPTEPKWKPFEMGSYATNQMAALAAQHGHGNRGGEEEAKKAYLDPSGLQRSTVVGNSRASSEVLHPGSHGEVSAMQSLIKYSGNFAKETSARPNGGIRSPFGGLGNMKLEANPLGMSKVQHLPPQQCGKQLKRDPERPESAKSFGRESIGSQGEVEVRHPPVGIAVAVARQKDNTSKPSSNLGDRDRSIPVGSIKGSGRADEDRMDDRSRHRDDRLLAGRLEREQEKLLRESKELADFARIHQPGVSASGLNPNLMVTGGPSLAGPGRWPTDPTSHLASHHWIPRTGSSSMWLAGSPYSLGHPSLHQGMAPGYHPGMPGSIPSPYQFARDPQSGQLLVIPTDHLPHFAELMERAPPLWSAMYPPAGSSLQHAHQLQLLSHQQLLRQHELYMLQQQAAQAMELQRSAQLVERLKASEHRAEMEDKAAKRSHEGAKQGLPAACAPTLHSRKPPSPSPTPSTSYSKALTPQPLNPSPSPVTTLKSEVRRKIEEAVPQQPYSHPSTPAPHPSSPAPASPPPEPPIPPKEEALDETEKKEIDLQKEVSAPFQALFPEIPQGYPFQSITARFGSHYPYLLQPAAASDADGLAPDVPLPAETSEHLSASVEVKPMRLHPTAMVESLQPAMGPEPMEESAVNKEESDLEETEQSPGDQNGSTALAKSVPEELQLPNEPENQSDTERHTDEVEQEQKVKELQKGEGTVEPYRLIDCAPEMEPLLEEPEEQARSAHAEFDNSKPYCGSEVQEVQIQRERSSKAKELCSEADEKDTFAVPSSTTEPPPKDLSIKEGLLSSQIAQLDTLNIKPDDPMAGMIALVAASELPQTCSLPTHYTPMAVLSVPKMTDDCSPVDPAGLHGIALLSEIAELELERRKNEIRYTMRADLESLLVAGTQVLMEALACKPAVTIQLPRELNPNKKYSWMQKKDEPLFSIKSAIEGMGAMELDYRVRLAELQRRYKDKQREMAKLQKRRDAEEKREEKNRSLARRGPGRPRKRKHGLASPPVGKSDCKVGKLGKTLLLSEDSETGEGLRKRFRGLSAEDEDEMDGVSVKVKRKSKIWDDASSSFSEEVQTKSKKKKKKEESEQEQLATKLDKALSLTKLSQLGKSHFKFADGSAGKSKSSFGSCSKRLGSHEMEFPGKEGKKNLSQSLSISQKSSKEGKNKMAAKAKKMEFGMKVKGHLKASHSPARSEVSSYSYNTDTEEEDESAKYGWPSHSALSKSGSRGRPSRLHGSAFTKSRQSPKRGLSTSSSSSAGTLKSKQAANKKRHKHFALLLQEAEARSSFSDSSEDSFDQDYTSEEDEDELEEEYDLNKHDGLGSPSLDESGLGLLARFAASAMPSPIIAPPLSVIQLEAKQKAKKKEERQSLMGTEFEYTDSESDIKIKKASSLLYSKKPLLDSAVPVGMTGELPGSNKVKLAEKRLKKVKSPREFSFEFSQEVSDDDRWPRRRSERIFLHDATLATPLSPSRTSPPAAAKPARSPKAVPQSPKKEASKPKEEKDLGKKKKGRETPLCLSPPQHLSTSSEGQVCLASSPLSPSKKSKVKVKPREVKKEQARGKGGAVSKLMESMAADEDFEPNQDSSFSEDENVPLSALIDRPNTPGPRNCVIDKDELKDGLRVLIPMDDKLLYAGHVQTVHSPDIYRVVVEGERGNRPHIYSLEQLLQEAIIDVKPPSVRYLPEGTRIAAYWSQQYRCLYPGTVVRGSPDVDEGDDLITVEFDDGDTGRIPLSHIRLLPPDYKIQCAEPSPALLVPSTTRRSRKSSKDAGEGKEASVQVSEEPVPKSRGRGRRPKPKPGPEVVPEDREQGELSASTDTQERSAALGKPGSRPARKCQQSPNAGSSVAMPTEMQKKIAKGKIPAKGNSQQQASYTGPVFGNVLSDSYSDLLGSFIPSDNSQGKVKSKKGRKGDEAQRKQPESELMIKLDHEGVTSPKTKKTKALMMMEDQSLSGKRDNKNMMGMAYPTVMVGEVKQKAAKTKAGEKEKLKAGAVTTYSVGKLGRSVDGLVKVKEPETNEEEEELDDDDDNSSSSSSSSSSGGSSSSGSSESDGEEEEQNQGVGGQEDSTSNSSRASSPISSTNSSTSSSSSSSSTSSSGSSSSSSTTDEDSCSSDEETPASPHSTSPTEQAPPQAEDKVSGQLQTSSSSSPSRARSQKQQQSKNRPKKREGIHLPTTKELAKRQRLPSVENRPKIAAFLPARQLWKWFGKPTQRRGMKGKAKKLFYKAIVRGKEIIRIGDSAVFLSAGRPNLPYIGHIQSMWESWGNNMVVRVKWFYHPEETNPGRKLHDRKQWDQKSGRGLPAALQASNQRKDFMERALYQSSHIDENDVQTVSHKCLVVSLEQYEQMIKTKKYQDSEDLYYLAGTYEPTTGMIFNTDGVPIIC